jgi:hypothetical protein
MMSAAAEAGARDNALLVLRRCYLSPSFTSYFSPSFCPGVEQYLVGAGTFPLPLLSLPHHVALRLFPFLLLSLILILDERIISCSESRFMLAKCSWLSS